MNLLRLLVGMAALAAVGCRVPKPTSTEKTTLHVLVASSGKVELRKRDWTQYSTVSFGALIAPDDLLLVAQGGTANIVCSDLSKQSLGLAPPGPVPCAVKGELTAMHPPYGMMRGEISSSCPALISPRAGRLSDPRPEVRWKATAATRDYTVTLKAGDTHWQREVHLGDVATEGRLPYPSDVPQLPPGKPVTLTISGDGHSSDDCAPLYSELRLLEEAEQISVRQAEARIQGLRLSAVEADYLRANLLLSHFLYAEAIALLESISRMPGAPVAVDRLLGDAYGVLELNDYARAAYQKALDGIGATPDTQTEAALNGALAKLTADEQKQEGFAKRAIALYTQLGDRSQVDELNKLRDGKGKRP